MFNYREAVLKTANRVPADSRLIAAACGLCSKSGVIVELIQKTTFHGVPFDRENLIRDLGDVYWYLELACLSLNISLSNKRDILSNVYTDHILLKLSLKLTKRTSWVADHISDFILDRKPSHDNEMKNRLDEINSCLHYFAQFLNISVEEIQQKNIQRLKLNYPENF